MSLQVTQMSDLDAEESQTLSKIRNGFPVDVGEIAHPRMEINNGPQINRNSMGNPNLRKTSSLWNQQVDSHRRKP